ncbi:hypothetical protein U9M48_037551 [Paspalum notatum var. saurae]|uniref:Uncharacterized protein n=1 Tax=Paspalum notatum var. saurae TaxID=547442 RepID=A0AAQ3UGN4_PASNO
MGYSRMAIPVGLVPPMCFCGDPCKLEMSDEDETFRRRYWMCANWAFDPPEKALMKGRIEPPPLCDFEEWIDKEVKEKDREWFNELRDWNAKINAGIAARKKEEEQRNERIAEEKHRAAAKRKAEREVKLARARKAKAALEENPNAPRKGKWPRCTHSALKYAALR